MLLGFCWFSFSIFPSPFPLECAGEDSKEEIVPFPSLCEAGMLLLLDLGVWQCRFPLIRAHQWRSLGLLLSLKSPEIFGNTRIFVLRPRSWVDALTLQICAEEGEVFWQLLHSQEGTKAQHREVQVRFGALSSRCVCVEELGVSQGKGGVIPYRNAVGQEAATELRGGEKTQPKTCRFHLGWARVSKSGVGIPLS